MAIITTLGSTIPTSTTLPNDISPAVSQAIESTVNAVVDAASKSGNTDIAAPDDTLLTIAIWIVDAAGTIAQDALNATQAALLTDTKAQRVADCARRWSIVAAIIAVVVTIIVAIVISAFTFGAGVSMVVTAIFAACAAITAAVIAIVTALPSIAQPIQVIVVGALNTIPTLSNPAVPTDQRELARKTATENLRSAMTMVQSAAAQHAPSVSVDLSQSLAVADQTSRALQKLLAYLRQQQYSGRAAVLVTELGQLTQTHSALVARLKLAQPTR
jgi:hypothetical protein